LKGHEGRVLSVTFSADGRRLISGSEDTTSLVWDITGPLGGKKPVPLSSANLDTLWTALASDAAAPAYQAIRSLSAAPKDFVPLLQRELPPIKPVDEEHVKRLIADLASAKPAECEKAAGELKRMVDAVAPALRKTLEDHPSAQVQRWLRELVESYDRQDTDPSRERRREMRALEALELSGTSQARSFLEELAKGVLTAWRTREAKAALTRLADSVPSPAGQ
jgi:hypothetical protein